MKKSRFTEAQIVSALKKQEAGISTREVCRELGVSEATFYNWKVKYGGMEISDVKKMKTLEEENARLKKCTQILQSTIKFSRICSQKKAGPCH
ncbi:MAG: transposase [Bacteroidetes bacterium]|nr:transposase [Bacteroidota bacterium]